MSSSIERQHFRRFALPCWSNAGAAQPCERTIGGLFARKQQARNNTKTTQNNDSLTLAVATLGMRLEPHHRFFLQPFTAWNVTTLGHLSARLPLETPEPYNPDGQHVRCFDRLVVCQTNYFWKLGVKNPLWSTAQAVRAESAGRLLAACSTVGCGGLRRGVVVVGGGGGGGCGGGSDAFHLFSTHKALSLNQTTTATTNRSSSITGRSCRPPTRSSPPPRPTAACAS